MHTEILGKYLSTLVEYDPLIFYTNASPLEKSNMHTVKCNFLKTYFGNILQFVFQFPLQDFKFRAVFWSLCGGCGGSQSNIPGVQRSAASLQCAGGPGHEPRNIQYLDIPNNPEVLHAFTLNLQQNYY